jgi:hypothetical protein
MALFPIQGGGFKLFNPITTQTSASLYGTHISHQGVGGFQEFPSSSYIYSIPIGQEMNTDGWSSGRRKFGMVVYDITGKKFYQLRPKLSGSATEVSASQFVAGGAAQQMVWLDPTQTRDNDDFVPITGSGNPADAWSELYLNGVTINNNSNNYVLTATGTTNTINGEQNFTFDGTTLVLTGSLSVSGSINAQSFFQNSSRTLKTNIIPFEKSAISLLDSINVVEFNYLNDLTNKHIGFIAEDTPVELSTLNQNVMDTNSTVGVLIKAVQELTQKVNELESKLK